jgi:hypothetical protein
MSGLGALKEVLGFVQEQGVEVEDPASRERGRRLVRDAIDDLLATADALMLRRLKNAEQTFIAVQEDLTQRGVITPAVAYERVHAMFGGSA